MSKIINLKELIDLRAEKQRELEYFTQRLDQLKVKLFFVQKEIDLTNFIINAIEKEKIIDLRELTNDSTRS